MPQLQTSRSLVPRNTRRTGSAGQETERSLVPRNTRRTGSAGQETSRAAYHAAFPAVLVIGALVVVAALRPRLHHIVVAGTSMWPTLRPGDRLIAVSMWRGPRVRGLALAPDPRMPERVLIKRVHAIDGGQVELRGDAAFASTDSRTFGTVPLEAVDGCVAFRYHPAERAGRVN